LCKEESEKKKGVTSTRKILKCKIDKPKVVKRWVRYRDRSKVSGYRPEENKRPATRQQHASSYLGRETIGKALGRESSSSLIGNTKDRTGAYHRDEPRKAPHAC